MSIEYGWLGIVGGIIIFVGILSYYDRYRLQQTVRKAWGRIPQGSRRYDKEESLKTALKQQNQATTCFVDDYTWSDLEMMAVFEQLNATFSSIGSEALYRKLRHFEHKDDNMQEIGKVIRFYEDYPEKREKIQQLFASLGKKDFNLLHLYLNNPQKQRIKNSEWFALLGLLPIFGLISLFFSTSTGLALLIFSFIFNSIIYYLKKSYAERELTCMNYFIRTVMIGQKLSKIDHPYQTKLKEAMKPLKRINWVSNFSKVKTGSETEVITEMVNMIFMLPFWVYSLTMRSLTTYQKEAQQLIHDLGDLEVAAAILNYRKCLPYSCQPVFQPEFKITAQELYHPLLKQAVPNKVKWQANTLVTGSNASGKSTYVKSVAISAILAQTIDTVPAKSFTMQRGHVLTSMGIQDDIFAGESYFVAELNSLQRMLQLAQTGEPVYAFVDEILKGTNTIERISASASFIKWADAYPMLCFVATHDIELPDILIHYCENIHFQEYVDDSGEIQFDYLLQEGRATSRNALKLLKAMGYPTQLVQSAEAQADFFEKNRTWKVFTK